jgi:hypothetical protein
VSIHKLLTDEGHAPDKELDTFPFINATDIEDGILMFRDIQWIKFDGIDSVMDNDDLVF